MAERPRFSQRKGIEPLKKAFQVDSIDRDLRVSLWNALTMAYWERMGDTFFPNNTEYSLLSRRLWLDFFKAPLETLPQFGARFRTTVQESFFRFEWNRVYDFIEFVANSFDQQYVNDQFMGYCNAILEREASAYRFVNGVITQITERTEISEIEQALDVPSALRPVAVQLRRSLELLSDRKAPDFRNSIKEAISAVETICNLIAGSKVTLGQALDRIGKKVTVHPALKRAFENLYGYTSDADGIRHALLEESNLSFEDAKFMLVSCSAFINYLKAKSSTASIKF